MDESDGLLFALALGALTFAFLLVAFRGPCPLKPYEVANVPRAASQSFGWAGCAWEGVLDVGFCAFFFGIKVAVELAALVGASECREFVEAKGDS